MEAQRYRHRIRIEEQVETFDSDTGAHARTWDVVSLDSETELSSVPAEVLTGPGREPMVADAKWSETAARINCRWFPGLTQQMRIVWDGRNFDIVSIETDATNRREYRLRVKAGLTDGA